MNICTSDQLINDKRGKNIQQRKDLFWEWTITFLKNEIRTFSHTILKKKAQNVLKT